jgi:hypothetical protein
MEEYRWEQVTTASGLFVVSNLFIHYRRKTEAKAEREACSYLRPDKVFHGRSLIPAARSWSTEFAIVVICHFANCLNKAVEHRRIVVARGFNIIRRGANARAIDNVFNVGMYKGHDDVSLVI